MHAEYNVQNLSNYIIIRTRFFDKTKIRFNTAAIDIFTSMLEVQKLVKKIKYMSLTNFIGVINIGDTRRSDYSNYKKFKKDIKPCKREDITKNLKFDIAKDASMNLERFKKLKR